MFNIRVFLFLILVFGGSSGYLNSVFAASAPVPPELKLTRAEITNKMAILTSLSKETITLLYKEQPHLFNKLEGYLHHQQLYDMLLEGRDFDAMLHIFSPTVDNYVDKVLKAAYPANFLTFIKVVSVYKGFLELMRDAVWFPELEKNMFNRYKTYRNENTSPENTMTFITATGGQYYQLKPKMYDELLRVEQVNRKLLTPKLENWYWGKIDTYWQSRLEARYQYEKFQQNQLKIHLAIHKKYIPYIFAVRNAVKPVISAPPKKIKVIKKVKPKPKKEIIRKPPLAKRITEEIPPRQSEPVRENNCYTSKYASKVSIARKANEASSPAGSIGLLYASPECESKFKNCRNHSIKLGAKCRQSSTGYDFKSINKKCNALVNKRVRQCAQQEVSCSEGVYRSNCNEKQVKHPKKVTNNCYTPYAEKVKRALQSNASNNPSGNMGIVLLNGSAECTAAHKKCSDAALKGGVKCRNMDHGGIDPVAVTKKCNIVVNTGWIKCAQQEVKCSASAFKRKCGQ